MATALSRRLLAVGQPSRWSLLSSGGAAAGATPSSSSTTIKTTTPGMTPRAPALRAQRRNLATGSSSSTRIFTWGQGTEGQLGHWPFEKNNITGAYVELVPRELLLKDTHNSLDLVDVACGVNFTAAVTRDGKVYTWGEGSYHKLGHGSNKNAYKPKRVEALAGVNIVKVACGESHMAAVDSEGRLYTWGWGGSMFGGLGGLGHGDSKEQPVPKLVESLGEYGCRVASVSCGEKHTLILTDDGEVLTVGNGEYGRLGNGGSTDQTTPAPVEFFDESVEVVQAVAGSAFNMILTKDGRVFVWGRNEQGQLGLGGGISLDVYSMEALPLQVEGFSDNNIKVKALAAGNAHAAAISEEGEVYMWGMKNYLEPQKFQVGEEGAPEKVAQVCCGGSHTAVVTEGGRLYTFGKGSSLCLGHAKKSYTPHPRLVDALEGRKVLRMSCGHKHMAAITE